MDNLLQRYGKTALVAGASEGMGAAFATRLAAEGFELVLVARRQELLEQLALTLRDQYKTKVSCISCDLADVNATQRISENLNGKEIDVLVYNAALPYIGHFIKNEMEYHNRMARVNMITPMNMLHLFGEGMLRRKRGAIVLMTSIAGFQGSGFLSMYAATKAFNRILGESLWYEWKGEGVDVIASCAGATATPNFINSQPAKAGMFSPPVQRPEQVVSECFSKLGKYPSVVTGRGNRFVSFIMQKLLPRKMAITIMGDTTRKMYKL